MLEAPRLEELRQRYRENPRRYFAPLASELRRGGLLTEAVALCRTHLPQHPEHLSGFIVYGQALYDLGELTEARAVFEQALGVDPENLVALRFLGDIAKRRGDAAAARRWYERVLEADPRNDDIASQLAGLTNGPPEPVPYRPPRADPDQPVANEAARREAAAAVVVAELTDPFAFPDAPEGTGDVPFEEGLTAPLVWPDTADLVARKLTPRALPAFPMPVDEETIAAFGREGDDPLPAPTPPVPAEVVAPREEPASVSAVAAPTAEPPPVVLAVPAVAPPPAEAGAPDAVNAIADDVDAAVDAVFVRAAPAHAPPLPGVGGSEKDLPPAIMEAAAQLFHEQEEEDGDEERQGSPPSAFYTETMAELLLAQGFVDRAVEVYEALVAQRPDDVALRVRLVTARNQRLAAESPMPTRHDGEGGGRPSVAPSPVPASGPAPVLQGPSVTPPVTARERLARLVAPKPAPRPAAGEAVSQAVSFALPDHDPMFTGPGRAADERVARQWGEALCADVPRPSASPDAFDRLWETAPGPLSGGASPSEPSLEQLFALAAPVPAAAPGARAAGAGGDRP